MFWYKSDHIKCDFALVLYLFLDISFLNQKKAITLSYHVQVSFINKKINTCTAKLQEVHSETQHKIFRVLVFISKQSQR